METLLQKLRNNAKIKGIRIKGSEHKVKAFADDLLVTISDPINDIRELAKEFKTFELVSGMKHLVWVRGVISIKINQQ